MKYGLKIFTAQDITKKIKHKTSRYVYVSALDNIFTAMKGHRLFEAFGFDLPKNSEKREVNFTKLTNYEEWLYDSDCCDWVNHDTGQLLTNYKLPPELAVLLESNIDTELE